MRHAERAGFVREGVRRKAYDATASGSTASLYGLIEEDLAPAAAATAAAALAGVLGDVLRDGHDLRVAEASLEGRHAAAAVPHLAARRSPRSA